MKIVLGFAVLVAVSFACGGLGAKEEIRDFREIKQEYVRSVDEAQKKFGGKEVTVMGTVMYRSETEPYINVGSKTDNDISGYVPDIKCVYEKSDVLFNNANVDSVIKIKGTLKFTESSIEMNPCKYVPF